MSTQGTVHLYSTNYGIRQQIKVSDRMFTSDSRGVFSMPQEYASRLLGTPGWKLGVPDDRELGEIRKIVVSAAGSASASEAAVLGQQIEMERLKAELAEAKQKQAEAERVAAEAEAARAKAELEALKAQVAAQQNASAAPPSASQEPAKAADQAEGQAESEGTTKAPRTRRAPAPE